MYYYEISLIARKLTPLTYASHEELQIGQFVTISARNSNANGIVICAVKKPEFACKNIDIVYEVILPDIYFKMAKFIATYYVCELGEAFALFEIFNPKPLDKNELIESKVKLSNAQNEAHEFLKTHKIALLFGDTGSGKTEIYMKRIDEILALNKTALMLLPEIALTPQTMSRLTAHYGKSVAIWHSKITKAAKKKTLEAISNGTVRILVGARSALFVPMPNLGLIIVDEEHDDSFKSESTPRYNAKDLAIWLGSNLDINIILGSATPSLASYIKFPYFRLKGGYYNGGKKYIFEDKTPQVSNLILHKLSEAATKNLQSVVFLPTRANFKYLVCGSCKAKVECAFCAVGMSLHKNDKMIKCHYCGWSQQTPKKCASCGGELIALRIGTMEASETIREALAHLNVSVLDRDAASTPKKLGSILQSFALGDTNILVGTQMLSKGHDYGNIGLAVVIGLDSVLASSDFRAKEKALSLLLQLAGRAGRKGEAEVLIQTQNREFFEKYLQDYEMFLQDEKLMRANRYPPFIRFCRLIFAFKNINDTKNRTELALKYLQQIDGIEIVGHGEALINRIADKFRYEILLKSSSASSLIGAAMACLEFGTVVDMDPLSFS
ncbi:MAG: hypothetical protein RL154_1040 [Pseudomonadota bacterium]|jgi:primosomal protein N' (replication factor Y)